jgi:hypothetical protein
LAYRGFKIAKMLDGVVNALEDDEMDAEYWIIEGDQKKG